MPNSKKPDHLKRIRVNTRQPSYLVNELVEKTGLSVTEAIELAIRTILAFDNINDDVLFEKIRVEILNKKREEKL